MDFIYGLLADFYIVFLILGIVFAVALLGFLSKITKRKEKKNESSEEENTKEPPKESTLPVAQIQPPGSLVIDTPHKPVEPEPEVYIEPSLDDLEVKVPTAEPSPIQNTYDMNTQMQYTQPMPQVQYPDPNQIQYTNQGMMTQQQMINQMYMTQPMPQMQYPDPNQMQYANQGMMVQPQMINQMMQPQMQTVVQEEPKMETIEFITETNQQQEIQMEQPQQEVKETIEFFEIKDPTQEEPVQPKETIELRKFDINQAKALEQELASKHPANTPEVYDAEPTFGLVIEDTGSSVGTNV